MRQFSGRSSFDQVPAIANKSSIMQGYMYTWSSKRNPIAVWVSCF